MTMTEHISEAMMSAFCSRALSATDTIECAEHLEMCPECSQLFDHISKTSRHSRRVILDLSTNACRLNDHLDYDQLSGYLDSKLDEDEIEIVKGHLDLCSTCYIDLLELKEFRNSVEPELKVRYAPRSLSQKILEWLKKIMPYSIAHSYGIPISMIFLALLVSIFLSRFGLQLQRSQGDNAVAPVRVPLPAPAQLTGSEVGKQPDEVSKTERRAPKSEKGAGLEIADAVYDNGRQYGIDKNGNPVGIQRLPSDIRETVAGVLTGQIIDRPQSLDDLVSVNVNERGGAENKGSLELLSPVGTLIKEERPALKWKPLKEGISYVVKIVNDEFELVVQSPNLTTAEWLVPVPLARDQVYIWQVTAFDEGKMIESGSEQVGKFKIISASRLSEIEAACKKYNSHLASAALYLKEGLLENAGVEFRHLLNSNPNSRLVKDAYLKFESSRAR